MSTATERTRGPGDLLADRYRLSDLLSDSHGGRFWRAHDIVLSRDVAVHLIAADDPRADGLLRAARRSAALLDRRILRVLDADSRDDVCYVVTEWADGTSLDILLDDGPLGSEQAAWLTSEVGAALASAHETGYAHGRLLPESVLIDRSGSVRIIGFAVDAALIGLPPASIEGDVVDLAAILYAALTGRWPGRAPSERVPPAPHEAGRVLRARQVRAGVPTPLDTLCDQVLAPGGHASHARTTHDLSSAHGISAAVVGFVGDPAAVGQSLVAVALARSRASAPISLPPEVPRTREQSNQAAQILGVPDPGDTAERSARAESELPEPTPGRGKRIREPELEEVADSAPATDPLPRSEPVHPSEPEPPIDPDLTQAGVPIFHDDPLGGSDVSWFSARAETPPPPPPFEATEPKPLFAPTPADGEPLRRPRPATDGSGDAGTVVVASGAAGDSGFWPWAGDGEPPSGPIAMVEEPAPPVPGRGWLRIAGIVAITGLLLLAILAAYNMGRGRPPLGGTPEVPEESTASAPAAAAAGQPLKIASVADFDPQAEPPEERPDLVPLSFDGDPDTAWRTETYLQNFGPSGLKTGLGLIIDLGTAQQVSEVAVEFNGEPTTVEIGVSTEAPAGDSAIDPLVTVEAGERLTATLDEPTEGRYVTVWLTSLPPVNGGFRAEIAELAVRG